MTLGSSIPSQPEIMRSAIRDGLMATRVCLPARVTAWDPVTCRIKAQPLIRRVYRDETGEHEQDLPIVHNVPVQFMRWGGFVIRCPIQPQDETHAGDVVALLVADRDLDAWLAGDGSPAAPDTARLHDLSDAFAIPGFYPLSMTLPGLADGNLVIGREDGSAELSISAAGLVVVEGAEVKLGAQAAQAALLGDAFMSAFKTWVTGVNAGIAAAATAPAASASAGATAFLPIGQSFAAALDAPGLLSTKVKIE